MIPARLHHLFFPAAVFFLLILSTIYLVHKPSFPGIQRLQAAKTETWQHPLEQHGSNRSQDNEVLQLLQLTSNFEYRRQCIKAEPTRGLSRQSLVNVTWPLSAEPIQARLDRLDEATDPILPPCQTSYPLQVPAPDIDRTINTGSLILGAATDLKRLNGSLSEMSRWLANTNARLVVLLRDQPESSAIDAVQQKAERLHMNVTIVSDPNQNQGEAQSNFGLARLLYSHRTPETKWYGVMDDDTFFLSLNKVLQALAHYDTSKSWYVGTLGERHFGVSAEGMMAFGGAGMFFSPPLLETIAEHTEECMSLAGKHGDLLWRDCLIQYTSPTVQLTKLPGLNQLDIFDDPAGWYESGQNPILTLHHWKSWYSFPVHIAHLVSDVAGVDSFLQRYQLADDLILTNGFSLVQYPNGLPDLKLVEGTFVPWPGSQWPEPAREFVDSFGKLRPALEEGKDKISWRFEHAVKTEHGCVRQFYVKRATSYQTHEARDSQRDSVIEIDWCSS